MKFIHKLEDRGAFSFYVTQIRGEGRVQFYVFILYLGFICPKMKLKMKMKMLKKKKKMTNEE